MRSSRPDTIGLGDMAGAELVRERRTTQEMVHNVLREAILSGQLHAGARLIQDQVASELNVSRVPVREALLQLESEGLVRMEAHRGASVVWHSPEEVEELLEMRSLLLIPLIRRAVPDLSDDQIQRLEQVVQRQEDETSMPDRARLHKEFYAVLLENIRRPRIMAQIAKLERAVERYLLPTDQPPMGHVELVAACRERDAARVADLADQHMQHLIARASKQARAQMA